MKKETKVGDLKSAAPTDVKCRVFDLVCDMFDASNDVMSGIFGEDWADTPTEEQEAVMRKIAVESWCSLADALMSIWGYVYSEESEKESEESEESD